jgi:hypothetical protein
MNNHSCCSGMANTAGGSGKPLTRARARGVESTVPCGHTLVPAPGHVAPGHFYLTTAPVAGSQVPAGPVWRLGPARYLDQPLSSYRPGRGPHGPDAPDARGHATRPPFGRLAKPRRKQNGRLPAMTGNRPSVTWGMPRGVHPHRPAPVGPCPGESGPEDPALQPIRS